jgi:hypothetical protein
MVPPMTRSILTALVLFAAAASSQDLTVRGTVNLTPRTHIDLRGSYAYTTGANNLTILDISNPASPQIVGQAAPGIGSLLSVAVEGNYAYCAGQGSGLVVIDIHNPENPVWVMNRILPYQVLHATAYDTLVAVATMEAVYLLGVSNPASPNILDSYGHAATWAEIDGLAMRIHCGSNSGGFVLSIDNDFSLQLDDQFGTGVLSPVAIASPYVNFADGAELQVVNAATYNLAGTHNAQGAIKALAGAERYSFVGLVTGEIQYLNQIQNEPALVTSATVQSGIAGLALNPETRILVAAHSTGVTVLEYDALSVSHDPTPALPNDLSLAAYPNPFNSTVNMRLDVPSPGLYQLTVMDILGRVMHSESLNLTASRTHELDFSAFAAGNYFIRWSNPTASTVVRVVFQP